MAENFVLGGEPWSIRSSAKTWSGFASSASTASSDIRGVDAGDFVGDEGDTFRSKVNDDLPPNLDTTSEAWGIVAAALTTYADKLEEYQSQLASLKTQYDNQQQTASEAATTLANSEQSDRAEQDRITTATSDLEPGAELPPSDYVSQTAGAQSASDEANQNVQDTLDAAAKIRSNHRTAVDTCCQEIDKAKDLRFEKPPGFWGKLKNSVCDWIADHADILKAISGVLKVISAIAGVLSFIPVLAPIMGPIALVAGGAALAIDVAVKLATGEGSWLEIGIDAAGMLLPGVGKLLKPAVMGTKGGRAVNALAGRGLSAVKNSSAAKNVSKVKNFATDTAAKVANKPMKMAINGFKKGEPWNRRMPKVKPSKNGFYDVGGHGNPHLYQYVQNGRKLNLDHRATAKLIKNQKDYDGGGVRLLSCSTGKNADGFAQNLANKMGVPVEAPSDLLYVWPSGRTGIGPSPNNMSGGWRVFYPLKP